MVGRIAKFLRRQTPDPPEVTEAIAQLAHLAETQADLRQAAALQSALLRAMYAAPAAVLPVAMTAEDAVARLDGGVPLLRNVVLPCEACHLHGIFIRLCKAAIKVKTKIDNNSTILKFSKNMAVIFFNIFFFDCWWFGWVQKPGFYILHNLV